MVNNFIFGVVWLITAVIIGMCESIARKTILNRHWGHRFLEFSTDTVKTVCRSLPYYSTLTTAKRRSKSGRLRSTIDVHATSVCLAVDQLLRILNSFTTLISAYPYNRHLAFEFLYHDGTVGYFFFFCSFVPRRVIRRYPIRFHIGC